MLRVRFFVARHRHTHRQGFFSGRWIHSARALKQEQQNEQASSNSLKMASRNQRKAALSLARREVQQEIDDILDVGARADTAEEDFDITSMDTHEIGNMAASKLGVETVVQKESSRASQGKVFSQHDLDEARPIKPGKRNPDGSTLLGEVIENPKWYGVEKPGLTANFNEAEAMVQYHASSSDADNEPVMDPSYFYEAARAADIDLGRYASGESIPSAMAPSTETAEKTTAMPMPWERGDWWDSLLSQKYANETFDALKNGQEVPDPQPDPLLTTDFANAAPEETQRLEEKLNDHDDPDVVEAEEWSRKVVRYLARVSALPDSLTASTMPKLEKEGIWEVPSQGVLYNPLRGEEKLENTEQSGARTIGEAKARMNSSNEGDTENHFMNASPTSASSYSASGSMDLLSGLRDDLGSSHRAATGMKQMSSFDVSEAHQSAVEEYISSMQTGREKAEEMTAELDESSLGQSGEFEGLNAEKPGSGSGLLAKRDPNFRKLIENPEDSEYMSATEDQEDYRAFFREHKQGEPGFKSQQSGGGFSRQQGDGEVTTAVPENPEPERDWGWSDSQPGYHMYKRIEQGERPSPKSLNHSRAYHPYHKRLLEAMERKDLMTMFLLWNYQRNRAIASGEGPGADKPDFIGYHIMIDACARAKCFDAMAVVLDDMTRRAVETTPEMHKLFIKAAALSDQLDTAIDAFKKMVYDAGHKPDIHAYSPIISTAMRLRNFDIGFDWFNRMRRAGIYPTDSIFRSIAKPLVEDAKYKELHFLWKAIRNHTSVPLQSETWSVLLQGFHRANDAEDLWSVYQDMTSHYFGEKIIPGAQQMADIFNCLASNRYFREARYLRRDMETAGYISSGEIPVKDIDSIMARFPPEDAEMETRQRTVDSVYGNPYFTDDVEPTQKKSEAVLQQEQKIMQGTASGADKPESESNQ